MFDLINYLLTLNVLDLGYDIFYYVKEVYPNITSNINNLISFIHNSVSYSYLFWKETVLNIVLMKYLNSAIFNMGFKFLILIALLVFVRGGIPRYRFDFLTKIGWIKFLSLILSIFLSSMLLIFLI